MLKKRLGTEAIENDSWTLGVVSRSRIGLYYKIPSTLIIPKDCEKIGDWAFWRCRKLRKVVISESVKKIENYAFRECKKLEKVITSEGVLWISTKSFQDCESLKKVVIPKSVKFIGTEAFRGCKNATIILKKPMSEFKKIELSAFSGCRDVKEEVGN